MLRLFFFQAEDGIRDFCLSRGLGDGYNRQPHPRAVPAAAGAPPPPAVATGLLLGAGHPDPALRAGLLTVTNVVALNLAAVCTFLLLGVRPRDWRDVAQARTSTRIALVLWGSALAVLALLLWQFA